MQRSCDFPLILKELQKEREKGAEKTPIFKGAAKIEFLPDFGKGASAIKNIL